MIDELFPEAIQILDKFHLIENITNYGKFIFNDDTKKVEKFRDKIIGYCYSREYDLIVKELKKYKDITVPKTVCNLPVYLENNKSKIDYSTYEHNDWFVGSGAIESSNKTVVQLRLKQAGMRWSVEGANYMIALRCMYESDHWSEIEKTCNEKIEKCVSFGSILELMKIKKISAFQEANFEEILLTLIKENEAYDHEQ